jgi:phenylpropionate dioxygenase-like ring-hydroxylating dioxygenase large terminal subunit
MKGPDMTTMPTAPSTPADAVEDHRTSDRVLDHLDRGNALPGDIYTDPALYAAEVVGIFGRQWLYAGHVSQLPSAGDFLTVDVGHESGIVIRDRQGDLHGLLNVCRHRGARLVDAPCGSTRKLVCPYHQWTYHHDGSLAGAPRMPEGFDRSEFPLRRLHTAVWQGLIFVNFSQDPVEDLAGLLGSSDALMAPFDIAGAKVAHTEVYDVPANWKLVWENSQECYHCNANHPEFIRTFDTSAFHVDALPSRAFTDDRRVQGGRFPLKRSATSLTMTGDPASARPLGRFADGLEPYTASTHLKPGFATVFSPDYGIVFSDLPSAVDATRVKVQWMVHENAVEGQDYDVDNLKRVWDQTNRQDWDLCGSVQQGVRSAGFTPGPLSLDESSVAAFYYSYAQMLASAGY